MKTPEETRNPSRNACHFSDICASHERRTVLKGPWICRTGSWDYRWGRTAGRSIMSAKTPTSSARLVRSENDHQVETGGPVEVHGSYRVRLASSEADRLAAFRLRFLVFNLELNEGLDTAYATGCDTDEFDAV